MKRVHRLCVKPLLNMTRFVHFSDHITFDTCLKSSFAEGSTHGELSGRSPVLHVGSPSSISIYHESGISDQNSLPRKDLQSAKIMIPVPSPQVIFMRYFVL
jgi:hypothetical protein